MKHRGRTLPFRAPGGEVLPESIAETGFHRLGGVDQWVMVRGESIGNPALILLHGGPGLSETALFRHFNAPLEHDFVVVYWDQRGAGRSFDRRTPASSMTVGQFLADLDELVDVVRARLGQGRVVIFGHSWGAALGVLYAARHPQMDGLRWAVAGHDRAKLERACADTGVAPGAADVLVADSRDQASVDDVVARTPVLASTAGPFARYGPDVVYRECLEYDPPFAATRGIARPSGFSASPPSPWCWTSTACPVAHGAAVC